MKVLIFTDGAARAIRTVPEDMEQYYGFGTRRVRPWKRNCPADTRIPPTTAWNSWQSLQLWKRWDVWENPVRV